MVTKKRTSPPRPSPEEFDDYQAYLKAMAAHLKDHQRGFSFRSFARRAGYSSPSALHDVIEGRAKLSPSAVAKFASGLGLSQRETEAFEALVQLGRAKTDEERNRYYERLRRNANRANGRTQFEKAQYDVYTLWYALPIREMLSLPDFEEDPQWIAKRIFPRIKQIEAKKALSLLEEVGLAERDPGGSLRPASAKLTTPPTLKSLAVRNYHRAMLEQASATLDGLPAEERNITSLSFTLRKDLYEEFSKRIWEFEQELANWAEEASADTSAESEVFLLNVQLFPLTRKKEES